MSDRIDGWIWSYNVLRKPLSVSGRAGITAVGKWTPNDAREWYSSICVYVLSDDRVYPMVPYWHGFREPEFGCPHPYPEVGTLEDAIALCETYLAKDALNW